MPEQEDLPEILKQRMARQRKRSRIVLVSFAVTFAATLAVFFVMAQSLGRSNANRVLYVAAAPDATWFVDQQLPLDSQAGVVRGTFRLAESRDGVVTSGPTFDGTIYGAVAHDGVFNITTTSRLLRFKRNNNAWEQLEALSLGLNDPGATPVVAVCGSALWLFWAKGADLLARPALQPDVEPVSLFKAGGTIRRLHGVGGSSATWLSILEEHTGELHVLAVNPALDPAKVVIRKAKAPATVARSNLAVVGTDPATAVPVLAFVRKDDATRGWQFSALVAGGKPEGEWQDVPALPMDASPFSPEASGFVSMLALDGELHAWFAGEGSVRHCHAAWKGPEVSWGEPREVPLDVATSEATQIMLAGILFVLALGLMSQGVYLVLNRERPQDRSLKVLLARTEGTAQKKKAENKLVFAAGPLRAIALLVDLALTCPVMMALQKVYDFRWEDAYGFIVLVSLAGVDGDILRTVAASAVTLCVLAIYSLFCEMMWGRTLGKALFRMRVVDLEGETPSPWRLVVRNLVKIVELIHWTVVMIPLGMMMFSGRQQRLGDLLGGTVVIIEVVPEESPDDIDV